MKIKTLVTAILGITLVLPVMANTHSISQNQLIDDQKTRSIFMGDDNKSSSSSISPLAGAGIVFTGSTSGGAAYYLDGRIVPFANDCHTTINGSMRIIVNVVDDFGQVDSIAIIARLIGCSLEHCIIYKDNKVSTIERSTIASLINDFN